MLTSELQAKYEKLLELLRGTGGVAVAFSGGVDSAFLLAAAREALGEKVLAVTAVSAFFPCREQTEAEDFCRERGIRHILLQENILAVPGVKENPKNRCYLCKTALFTGLMNLAAENGLATVAEGSNLDDEGDYRPGLQAIRELGVMSPLRLAGFSKAEIRAVSAELGLPTAAKPSYACLASRFPYGDEITENGLRMVDRAEAYLHSLGFAQLRVRVHGSVARLETEPGDIARFADGALRTAVYEELKKIGFSYVALDLKGYRSGSLNETL